MTTDRCLSPPELAKVWHVKPSKILQWIRSGELRAFDISTQAGIGRPRWRIPCDAIVEFEQRRSAVTAPTPRRRRRSRQEHVIEYFK